MTRFGPARPQSLKRCAAPESGMPPARLPAERPTRILLAISMKIAAALGVTFPQLVLLRADTPIE